MSVIRGLPRGGRSAPLLLAVLLAVAASPAASLDPLQLCNVSVLPGLPSGSKRLVRVSDALNCLNAITLPYELAHEQIVSLAAYFEEFYVFNDIAADPLNSLHAEALEVPGMHTFATKAPMQARFATLAASFPKGKPVPLAAVVFGINSIMQSLRDGHTSSHIIDAFGLVLGNGQAMPDDFPWYATFHLIDTATLQDVKLFVKAINGTARVLDARTGRTIVSIAGLKPMTWVTQMASGPFSDFGSKSLGARVNKMLSNLQLGHAWPLLEIVSDLAPLTGAAWEVHSTNGSNSSYSSWIPMVGFYKDLYSTLSIAQLSAITAQPSKPYLALQNALNHSGYTPLPADPPPRPQELRRRSLDAAAAAATPGNLIMSNGQPVGNYNISTDARGKKFAVWKLTSFDDVRPSDLVGPWNQLIAWAKGNKTDRLIYDVTVNGGGDVDTGAWSVATLYPDLLSPNSTYPLINSNDRRVGPAAKYLIDNDLLLNGFKEAIASASNVTWLQERVAALNAPGSELPALLEATLRLTESVNILIANNTQAQSCNQGNYLCSVEWNSGYYPDLIKIIEEISASNVTVSALNDTLRWFSDALQLFAPFSEEVPVAMDGSRKASLYSNTTQLLRGSTLGEYTQRFFVATTAELKGAAPIPKSPFKQILAVTDGSCASSCDLFSRTAWFYSFNNPKAASFKFFTFGGTGHQSDITATSTQGGNAAGTDYLSMTWAYYAVAYATALWSGDKEVISKVNDIGATLPSIPPFTGSGGLPSFTQSQVYQTTMGPYALPVEYNLIPPDHYGKQWFTDYDGPSSDNHFQGGADLPEIYNMAARYFT